MLGKPSVPGVPCFDAMSLRSSMVYHRCYHHTLALHLNHLLFLNTYAFGILLVAACCGGWVLASTVVMVYAGYSIYVGGARIVPYACFVGLLGMLASYLAAGGGGKLFTGLAIVFGSFLSQLAGHALFGDFAAPPHRFHRLVAAPFLEYVSLLFTLGFWPSLRAAVDREVDCAREAARPPFLTREEIYGRDAYLFKVSLAGPPGAGKSSILQVLAGEPWDMAGVYTPTLGVDVRTLRGVPTAVADDKTAQVQVWDVAGSPRCRELASTYIRSSYCGTILVFDPSSADSLLEIRSTWLPLAKRVAPHATRLLLGTTKPVRTALRERVLADARALPSEEGVPLVLTSAEDTRGLQRAIAGLARKMREVADAKR